jgi:hypothetical protein
VLDADGANAEAVALGVFDEDGGGVEAHGLVVEQAAGEGGEVVDLEPGRGVGNEGEAGGVGLGEAVHGEGGDALDDVVLGLGADAVVGHAGAEAAFEVFHALHGAAHADGAAELFGFGAGEAGDGHGHAEKLLLKEGDTEGALEDRFERGVGVGDFLLALAAAHVGVHHFADDGAGTDDGDLDNEIVKADGGVVGDGGHLGSALDLEHAYGVGFAEGLVDERVFGEGGEVDFGAVMAGDEFDAVFEDGHHAEAEEIDLDEAEVGAVFLIPLNDGATVHGGALDGDDAV